MTTLERIIGVWGAPPDGPAWAALAMAAGLAFVACAPRTLGASLVPSISRRAFLLASAFAAAALSLGYVAYYLRGGPRIVDATMYWLQARALSEGHFVWSVPEPSASFRGRFLLFHESDGGSLSGIFPPGYPLLLAAGFAIGAPMIVGPALAAALVIATYALAREVARHAALDDAHAERIARLAALFSIVCAALRYHTADTMAHGASALGVTLAIASALHARRMAAACTRASYTRFYALAGLAASYVAATRFASAIPIGAVVLVVAFRSPRRARAIASVVLGAVPGVALLLVAQHAALGDALASTQRAYYALSDGPDGCFRYGFGRGIGCIFEHGDFVRAHGIDRDGYGLVAALGTTFRRLKLHVGDVANFELLGPLVLVPMLCGPRSLARGAFAVRCSTWLVLGQIAAYAPFYFDGNYPGGGARFFADVLPVEHVLLALACATLFARVDFLRKAAFALATSLAAFAVHAAFAHEALAARDGGRPLFEPDVIALAGVTHGLVFVESDHAFNLAHDPANASASRAGDHVAFARLRNDDHDRLLAESLQSFGSPNAYVYRLKDDRPLASTVADLARPSRMVPALEPFASPSAHADAWRFEAESDWPPLAQHGGWAAPIWASSTCASNGRALALFTSETGEAPHEAIEARIALPVPYAGVWNVTPNLLHGLRDRGGSLRLVRTSEGASTDLAAWDWPASSNASLTCADLGPQRVTLAASDHLELIFRLIAPESGPDGERPALDKTGLTPR